MGPGQAIAAGLRNYARFTGRATAPEFWWLVIALALVEVGIVTVFERSGLFNIGVVNIAGFDVSLLFAATCLALAVPLLSVSWRRLHDFGWAGWWVLIWGAIVLFFSRIIAIVAGDISLCLDEGGKKCIAELGWGYGFSPAMALLVFVVGFAFLMARPSQPDTNKYGSNPVEVSS